jgi:hypothetical protein
MKFCDESDRQRFRAVEDFSGKQHFLRKGLAHEFHEAPARTGGSEDAKAGFWIADLRQWCGNPEVGCISQFSTAAECETVNGGDYGHWQPGNPLEEAGIDAGEGIIAAAFPELGNVRSGGKDTSGSKLRPRKDEGSGIPLQIPAHGVQFVHHELVDGIANFWPIEFYMDGRADFVDLNRFHYPTFALLITKGPIPNQRMIIAQQP